MFLRKTITNVARTRVFWHGFYSHVYIICRKNKLIIFSKITSYIIILFYQFTSVQCWVESVRIPIPADARRVWACIHRGSLRVQLQWQWSGAVCGSQSEISVEDDYALCFSSHWYGTRWGHEKLWCHWPHQDWQVKYCPTNLNFCLLENTTLTNSTRVWCPAWKVCWNGRMVFLPDGWVFSKFSGFLPHKYSLSGTRTVAHTLSHLCEEEWYKLCKLMVTVTVL